MATDLEFRQQTQLPAIHLRPIKIRSNSSSSSSSTTNSTNKDHHLLLHQGIQTNKKKSNIIYDVDEDDDDDDKENRCVTPTSDEHKIPLALSCPAAPMKPRRVVLCKRKLSDELQFFEMTKGGRDQVDSFFRSSYEPSNIMSRKFKKTRSSFSSSSSPKF